MHSTSATEMQAEWTVLADHPALAGHFPGHPIVPGVLLLDQSLLRAAAWAPGLRWTLAQAKFLHPVSPGETLRWTWTPGTPGRLRFDIHSAHTHVASGVLQQEAAR